MGLGDTSYEQFNEMAISCDNSMAKMGATRLYELGAANAETYTTEDDFIKWKDNLWSNLFEHFGKLETTEMKATVKPKPAQRPQGEPNALPWVLSSESVKADVSFEYAMNIRNYQKSTDVTVSHVKEMRQKTDQGSTLEIMFNIKDTGIVYKTAGNLAIYAENSQVDVEKFAKLMTYDLDQGFTLVANDKFGGRKAQMPIP